jgi:hypothetical protein
MSLTALFGQNGMLRKCSGYLPGDIFFRLKIELGYQIDAVLVYVLA